MKDFNEGSHVLIKELGQEGLILYKDEKYALILTLDSKYWIPLEKLQPISIIDNLIQGNLSDSLEFILSIDAYRLINAYSYDPIVLASSTNIELFPHQIDEVTKILENPRMMIADEVGLGKTIVTGLVVSELYVRGLANKILFVVPKSLVSKWISELQSKFDITLDEILSTNIIEYFASVKNSPYKFNFAVSSLDFLRQPNIMTFLKGQNIEFDMVIFDEAHKLVKNEKFETLRYGLANFLSSKTKFLLLLTATPHDGDRNTFYNRMQLLETNIDSDSPISHLLIRNSKEDVVSLDGKEVFPKRTTTTIELGSISNEEKKFYEVFDDYLISIYDDARIRGMQRGFKLVITILRKDHLPVFML